MQHFEVAYITDHGEDLIIVPVAGNFGFKDDTEQNGIIKALQSCAASAGMMGELAIVWDAGGGRMGFRAPQEWYAFLATIDVGWVRLHLNRRLTCQ